MPVGKIKVRKDGGESGALGELNPVVGMTTINGNKVQKLNQDGTIVLSGNSGVGQSGVVVLSNKVFVSDTIATSNGSWPSGVDVTKFNWRAKSFQTTAHP